MLSLQSLNLNAPKFYYVLFTGVVKKNQGETVTMMCNTQKKDQTSVYLYARLPEKQDVMYYVRGSDMKDLTFASKYSGRVNISGSFEKLTIVITHLQQDDSGVYYCAYNAMKEQIEETETDSILLFVEANGKHESLNHL